MIVYCDNLGLNYNIQRTRGQRLRAPQTVGHGVIRRDQAALGANVQIVVQLPVNVAHTAGRVKEPLKLQGGIVS